MKRKIIKWCKHWKWITMPDGTEGEFMTNSGSESWCDDDFKFCPFCGAARPK